MKTALSIAGSDPSGGAGIQADLKTFHQHGVYGMAAITVLTAQSTREVRRVDAVDVSMVRAQLETLFADLVPDAVKTGALGSAEVVSEVAEFLETHEILAVVDPVMVSKHGASLLSDDAAEAVITRMVPRALLLMPNALEASVMIGRQVRTRDDAQFAGAQLLRRGAKAVLIKGGHLDEVRAVDVLVTPDRTEDIESERIDTRNTHGTGCTYSAAITARLARGEPLLDAIHGAKRWLQSALRSAPSGLGQGVGPLDHFARVDDAR